jgi:hypothetical protein
MSEKRRIDDKDLAKVTGGAGDSSLAPNPADHTGGGGTGTIGGDGETGSPGMPNETETNTGDAPASTFGR